MKIKLHGSNQAWNHWKFQIRWNKLEQVNPRSHNEQKNPFCVSSKINYFKDNVKTVHCFVHLQIRSLDTDDLFKGTPAVDGIQDIVTGNKMK